MHDYPDSISELVSLVKEAQVSDKVLKWATVSSEAEAEAHYQRLTRRSRLIRKLEPHIICTSMLLALIVMYFLVSSVFKVQSGQTEIIVLAALLTGVLAVGGCALYRLVFCSANAMLLAKPIAGTYYCVQAANAVKSCPAAVQWRDYALSQRTQLRGYDYQIMGNLRSLHNAKEKRRQRLEEYAQACREVHGISDQKASANPVEVA